MNTSYRTFSLTLFFAPWIVLTASCASKPFSDVEGSEPYPAPYVETYHTEKQELRFIAVAHEGGWGATHITIEKTFENFSAEVILLEGFANDLGTSPEKVIKRSKRLCADVDSRMCDEGSYAALLAAKKSIPFVGGEPDELEIKDGMFALQYSLEDLLGFYVVRQIPEWKREGTLPIDGLPARVDKFIQDYATMFKETTDFNWLKFQAWFWKATGKDFSALEITTEDPAPITGAGTTRINAISRDVEEIRNRKLMAVIEKNLRDRHKTLIVYGQGHLKELRPAFRKLLGSATKSEQIAIRTSGLPRSEINCKPAHY